MNRKISLDDTSVMRLRQVVLSTVRHETGIDRLYAINDLLYKLDQPLLEVRISEK
ncbi:MAG: hypothetical protein FWG67_04330 [Defluviitaleaceae bacterium]|nr:hypothetical protein [Defluviitaleaceae bacterium]